MQKTIYPVITKQSAFPFYLTGIGISEPEYHVKRDNGLVSHQFLFTMNGKGNLIIDGCSYIQKTGSIFYLSPAIPHEYYPIENDWTTCWFVFRGEHISDLMINMGFSSFMTADDINSKTIMRTFNMMLSAANNSVSGSEECSKLIYDYILNARKILLPEFAKYMLNDSVIDNAIAYINEFYSMDITLDDLALTAKISPQHFCRLFKSQVGMRPMEYIARRRVSEAKTLLHGTNDSMSRIGELCGYSDITYFGMVFRKYEGISPSEYRKIKSTIAI